MLTFGECLGEDWVPSDVDEDDEDDEDDEELY